MFDLRSFGSKCAVLTKVLVTLLGLYGASTVIQRPDSDLVHGEFCPSSPSWSQ